MTILRRLIRANGETADFVAPLSIADIEAIIGADVVDSVLLADRVHVMVVDDQGHPKGLPLNETATHLYWDRCGGITDHYIVGDVVIVPDSDFAPRGGPLERHSPP